MLRDTRRASLQAYNEMKNRGLSDPSAFETAVRIYLHQFPDTPCDDARFVVADWICEALGQ
ncbi:MAG: hypothetical protein H6905_10195 [Hyphomicrobiales bacterium]|nr:hypothetical protein [Hyphomicrobiales bacterium]